MPTLQEMAEVAKRTGTRGGVPQSPVSDMPTYAPRPQEDQTPDRARRPERTTTRQITHEETQAEQERLESKRRKRADKLAKTKAERAEQDRMFGFGGGDRMSMHEAPQLEDFWARFGPELMEQTQTSGFLESAMGGWNAPSASEEQYQQASQAGLEPFYERAKERTAASIDQALAARGAFGSSMGVGAVGQAMADLDAQQANREAEFQLTAAQQADRAKMSRLQGGLAGAMGADTMRTTQFNTAANVAQATQAAKRGRLGDYISDVMQTSGVGMAMVANTWQNLADADKEMFEQQLALEMGLPIEELRQLLGNQAQENADRQEMGEHISEGGAAVGQGVTGVAGAGGGGGGGGTVIRGGDAGGGGARSGNVRYGGGEGGY